MPHYILDPTGFTPIEVDMHEWAQWFELSERRVAATLVAGGILVSTVFIGMGTRHTWETMIFVDLSKIDRELIEAQMSEEEYKEAIKSVEDEWGGNEYKCGGNRNDAIQMHFETLVCLTDALNSMGIFCVPEQTIDVNADGFLESWAESRRPPDPSGTPLVAVSDPAESP